MFSCDFARHGCRHESLFLSEYKRTNRTKGTKILRCFPHCCPGHVNRSYCGAALHVRVQSHAASSKHSRFDHQDIALPLDELLVFAHFEEVGVHTFAMGDELPSRAVFQSIQSEQHPKGEWIQGAATDAIDGATQLFRINAGARWYYEWESAATKAQRFTKHVLKVYVVRASGTHDTLRIVAAASSSEFMVVSYRRAPSEISGDRRILALLAGNVARQSGELGLDPDNLLASLGQRMLPFLIDSAQANEDKNGTASPTSSWSPQKYQEKEVTPRRTRRRHAPSHPIADHGQSLDEVVEPKHLWAARHQNELRMAKRLAVLVTFLSAVQAADFQHALGAFGGMMGAFDSPHHHGETKSEAMATPPPLGDSVSWRFLPPLRHTSPNHRSPPSLRDTGIAAATNRNDVSVLITQCVEALAWVLLDESNRHTLAQLVRDGSQVLLSPRALRVAYLRGITKLHELIDRFFTTRFGHSFAQLHEDMVTALFRDGTFKHVRSQLLHELSSTGMAGFEAFVCLARQGFVIHTSGYHKRKRLGDVPGSYDPAASVFDGSWGFDGQQCSVLWLKGIPNSHSLPPLSVFGAIEWMREFASVTIALDASGTSMTLRSQWSLAQRGMALVLDGNQRVFDAFPSGVASTVPWNALAWGDYRAQLVGADCLLLEFSAWPVSPREDQDATGPQGLDVALRLKLCLRPVASPDSRAFALAVDGVVEHAFIGAKETLPTLPIERRHHAVDTWTPVYQLKAVYTAPQAAISDAWAS